LVEPDGLLKIEDSLASKDGEFPDDSKDDVPPKRGDVELVEEFPNVELHNDMAANFRDHTLSNQL